MSVDEYRRKYEAELRSARSRTTRLTAAAPGAGDDLGALIGVLSDAGRPAEQRQAALRSLKAASFQPELFEPYQAQLRQALRQVATEPKGDLRYEALQHLAREKDPFVQERLLEGLRHPEAALVAPAAALQMLAADDHGRAADAARQVLAGEFESAAKQQALRVLASDPKAQDLVAGIMKDKAELKELRQAGAVALRAISPTAFARVAQEIAQDKSDFEDIRQVAQTGLRLGQGEPSR